MVAIQECAGLPAVTDGEMRRSFWHYDFMGALTGLELVERDTGVQFHGMNLRPIFPTITGRLDFPDNHPMLNHFRYLASVSNAQPKISIPGPSACHFRTETDDIVPPEYEDPDVLFDDLAKTYNKAVHAFYEAGCRYLQMDDIFFAYLCDPKHRAEKKSQGMDPDWLISKYAKTMHDAISDRPEDMIIAMHLCRAISNPLGRPKALTTPPLTRYSTKPASTSTSWSMTVTEPVDWSHCDYCPGARSACSRGSSRQKRQNWNRSTTSFGVSTRHRSMPILTSLVSHPNAALPRPKKATD